MLTNLDYKISAVKPDMVAVVDLKRQSQLLTEWLARLYSLRRDAAFKYCLCYYGLWYVTINKQVKRIWRIIC